MIHKHRQTRIRAVAVMVLALVGILTTRGASATETTMFGYLCFPFDECPSLQEGDTICQAVFGSCSWMELNSCAADGCGPGIYRIECRTC